MMTVSTLETTDKQKTPWNGRGLTSFLISLVFPVLAVSGLVLYLAPSCRIARETGWSVLLLTKDQWKALHIIMACTFVVAGLIHVYFNWRVLLRYLFLKQRLHLKKEAVTALLLFLLLSAGAIFEVPPFSFLTALTEEEKAGSCAGVLAGEAAHPALGHGTGVGRMTVQEFCDDAGLLLEDTLSRLQEAGFTADPGSTFRALSQQKQMSPMDVKEWLLNKGSLDKEERN